MKNEKFKAKKMLLSKETIARLNSLRLDQIKGGYPATQTCGPLTSKSADAPGGSLSASQCYTGC